MNVQSRLAIAGLALFFAAGAALGQETVQVTVIDSSNDQPVPAADVCLLSDNAPPLMGVTRDQGMNAGTATFRRVPPGDYTVIAEKEGFRSNQSQQTVAQNLVALTLSITPGNPSDGPRCIEPGGLPGGFGVSPQLEEAIMRRVRLSISDLTINAAGPAAADVSVELSWNITYLVTAFDVRVGTDESFNGATWQALQPAPEVLSMSGLSSVQQASFVSDLGAGPVVGNSLFVQVRNRTYPYIVSNVLQGTIAAAGPSPPPTGQIDIEAGLAFSFAEANGWTFGTEGSLFMFNVCNMFRFEGFSDDNRIPPAILFDVFRGSLGFIPLATDGCHFTMFGGRELNEGWSFVSYNIIRGDDGEYGGRCSNDGTLTIDRMPQTGGQDIRLEVTIDSDEGCDAIVETITLNGPLTLPWTEAFVE
jgi:hypothetical protein